jgi:hypothetical protein
MNLLVKKLYVDSEKVVGDWHYHQTILDPEKFAESIIQECIVAIQYGALSNLVDPQDIDRVISDIHQHWKNYEEAQ